MNTYEVATAYLRLTVQADAEPLQNMHPALVNEISEVLNSHAEYVDGSLVNVLFEALAAQGMTSWVARFGPQVGVGSHGPVGFAALSAPNLGVALQVFSDFLETRTSGVSAHISQSAGQLHFELKDLTSHAFAGQWLIESTFLTVQNLIEAIMAHPLGLQSSLSFQQLRPAGYREMEALFHTACTYGAEANRLSIPLTWTLIPSPLSDPALFQSNLAKAREAQIGKHAHRQDVLATVELRLNGHFQRRLQGNAKHMSVPGLEVLAAELNMSPRTLIRKLHNENTTYRNLLAKVRRAHAQTLLAETHFTAAQIAEKLGYLEAANFGRAFKSWTGLSPTAWRRRQHAKH